MKKKILAILLVVAMVASLSIGLAACNKDDKEPAKASNSETLGTAIAVAANYGSGAASAASDEEPAEGFNLEFGTNLGAKLAFNTAIKSQLETLLKNGLDSAEAYANENGVKVEKATSDNDDFNTLYNITLSKTDDEGNKTEYVAKLYVNATKIDSDEAADVDGAADYKFTAKLVAGDSEVLAFSGTCKYNSTVDTMQFVFKLGVADSEGNVAVGLEVSAYANKAGNIVVGVNVGVAGIADASVSIELGKMADKQYGINVIANVKLLNDTATAKVDVKAIAASAEEDSFTVSGTVEATVTIAGVGSAKVTANVNGTAKYVEDVDNNTSEFTIAIGGTASVSAVAAE